MLYKQYWSVKVLSILLIVLISPLFAWTQQETPEEMPQEMPLEAPQENTSLPVLLSTGLPAAETPEEILPNGAVVYLRANNLQVLLENIDSLLTTFVPKKALPPELQPIFENPQPFITFFGMQAFGQPVTVSHLSSLIGIALDRPLSLALYPMPPDKGFVLSVPVANPTLMTGMLQGMLMPESVEKGEIGNVSYYRVAPSNPDLPRDLYIMASDKAVFVCGSLDVAQMLVNSRNIGVITADTMIAKGIQKYADRDLSLIVSPAILKPQLPFFQQAAGQVLDPLFFQMRWGIQQIPPKDRFFIETRLRLQLGVKSLDQLVDYVEAYTSGVYTVLVDELIRMLTNLDGVALAVNLEQQYQTLALTLYSQDIQVEKCIRPLPLAEIKQALQALPGEKSNVYAVGQTPQARPSDLVTKMLAAVEQQLEIKGLPMNAFLAFKEYYLTKPRYAPLESEVPWTLRTFVNVSEKTDFAQFNSLWELLKYTLDKLSAGPFLVSMKLLPAGQEGAIEAYFDQKAQSITQREQNYRDMRAKLPIKQPFCDMNSRFQQEDAGDGVKKLTFENVYTTRRGFFGYQQHEFINRQILFHQKQAGYELLYEAGADPAVMKTLLTTVSPAPGAANKLIEMAPAGAHTLSLLRLAHLIPKVLEVLSGIEDISQRELDAFLTKAQELVDTYGKDTFETKLLESGVDLPLLAASVHVGEDGKVYVMLPGGLHYPRPKAMPTVKELFSEFLAGVADAGGSASFVAAQPGELEISSIQSMEALALLVKTVVNTFYDRYMASPEGMELLFSTVAHPADFQDYSAEAIFTNPLWETVKEEMESAELELPSIGEDADQERTAADMRAIGTALGSYLVDFNYYPRSSELTDIQNAGLPQNYYEGAYQDAWNNPYWYVSDADAWQYMLISYGKDGVIGRTESESDDDLIFMNGQFIAPEKFSYTDPQWELDYALSSAVRDNIGIFVGVLLELGADPNATDDEGRSVLSIAQEREYADIVIMLKAAGATETSE